MYLLSAAVTIFSSLAVAWNFDVVKKYVLSFKEPQVEKVLWIYKNPTGKNTIVDITTPVIQKELENATIDPSKLPGENSRVEVRYLFKGAKYREVDTKPVIFPPCTEVYDDYTRLFLDSAIIEFPSGSTQDVTHRVRKYMGPMGDFHGHKRAFDMRWCFPHAETPGAKMRLEFTECYVHTCSLDDVETDSELETESDSEGSISLHSTTDSE